MTASIFIAETDEQISACWPCLHELRPHVAEDGFVARIRRMESEGYRLAAVAEGDDVVAVAGFRRMHTLFGGDTIYVDDLVTCESARSQGHGAQLVDFLRKLARVENCEMLHLDSGVQRDRAHAFYFDNGFHINCFHFALTP